MQFGSGSPLLGGTDALTQAMQLRGAGASALGQVGGGAPTAQPMPMPPTGVGNPPPQGNMQGMPTPDAMQGGMPQGSSEAELIIKALSERLKHDSKIKQAQSVPQQPQPPQVGLM